MKQSLSTLMVVLAITNGLFSQTASKPLGENDVIKLLELQIGDDAILAKVKKDGLNFAPDTAALERLGKAGASARLLDGLKTSAPKVDLPASTMTYADVLRLLSLGIDEDAIAKKIKNSPTLFTLDANQLAELKKAGASDTLIDLLQTKKVEVVKGKNDVRAFALILDCSGSMVDRTSDGETKMEAAKRVVASLVDKIPTGTEFTFIIYGHDAALKCDAVKVVRSLSPLDEAGRNNIRLVIQGLKPTGHTPIASALQVAGEQLSTTSSLSEVVLVTDGMETCHGDPIAQAKAIRKKANIQSVEVIGLAISKEEQEGVESIAKAGNGHFYKVENAKDLTNALKQTVEVIPDLNPAPPAMVAKKATVSSVVVKPWSFKGYDRVRIRINKTGTKTTVQQTEVFGKPILVPAGNYDLVISPFVGVEAITALSNFTVGERETVTIDPNSLLASIVVNDLNIPNIKLHYIRTYKSGTDRSFASLVQGVGGTYGTPMLVPAGQKYDVVVCPVDQDKITIGQTQPKAGETVIFGEGATPSPDKKSEPKAEKPDNDSTFTTKGGQPKPDVKESVGATVAGRTGLTGKMIQLEGTKWKNEDGSLSIDFRPDGKFTLNYNNVPIQGTWGQNGRVVLAASSTWRFRGILDDGVIAGVEHTEENGFLLTRLIIKDSNLLQSKPTASSKPIKNDLAGTQWTGQGENDTERLEKLTIHFGDKGMAHWQAIHNTNPFENNKAFLKDIDLNSAWVQDNNYISIALPENNSFHGIVVRDEMQGFICSSNGLGKPRKSDQDKAFIISLKKTGAEGGTKTSGNTAGNNGGTSNRVNELIEILKTGSLTDCRAAAIELKGMGSAALPAVDALMHVAIDDTSNKLKVEMFSKRVESARVLAIHAIAAIEPGKVKPTLEKASQSKSMWTKIWAVKSLQMLNHNSGGSQNEGKKGE